ncbi:MAG TPA: T9SS type A sorting domain-containing protein [Bacteroidia bacterium]|nr:T9SS type A sorting domain-containing protein [Bacteroidia bacterium]
MKAKKIKGTLLLAFAATICSAQILFTGNVQIANMSQARGIAACSDGGFGVVGDVYTSLSSSVFLTKLSASGVQQWSTNISKGGTQFYIWKAAVISLADSGFLVSTIQITTDSLYIFRVNKSGVVQWCKNVSYAAEACMIQSSDGGFLIVGTESFSPYNRIIIHKLDYSGTSQWDNYYQASGGFLAKPCIAFQNVNGDYTISSDCNYGAQKQIRIMRIQSNGTLIWANRYYMPLATQVLTTYKMKEQAGGNLNILFEAQTMGLKSKLAKLILTSAGAVTGNQDNHFLADTGMHASAALFTPDGGFAFAGYKLQNSPADSWVLKFDSLENLEWAELFPVAATHEFANQLVQNSSALAYSAWQFGAGTTTAQVSKISFSGQSACTNVPFSLTDSAYGIITTNDTIVTGTYMNSYSAPYSLLSGTTASISCTSGIEPGETEENDFTIGPGPAGSFLFIYPGKLNNGEMVFEIYDMRGRLVMNTGVIKANNADRIMMNISPLAGGIYVLSAKSKNGIVSRKFLKE